LVENVDASSGRNGTVVDERELSRPSPDIANWEMKIAGQK